MHPEKFALLHRWMPKQSFQCQAHFWGGGLWTMHVFVTNHWVCPQGNNSKILLHPNTSYFNQPIQDLYGAPRSTDWISLSAKVIWSKHQLNLYCHAFTCLLFIVLYMPCKACHDQYICHCLRLMDSQVLPLNRYRRSVLMLEKDHGPSGWPDQRDRERGVMGFTGI